MKTTTEEKKIQVGALMSREQCLLNWVREVLGSPQVELFPLRNDASFRRYFRVRHQEQTYVLMDAPVDREDSRPFVALSNALSQHCVVPKVLAVDFSQGFLLLTDLGNVLLLDQLTATNVDQWYILAMNVLVRVAACQVKADYVVPHYTAQRLRDEMILFKTWYLEKYHHVVLSEHDHQTIDEIFEHLIDSALDQPCVFVHRDYHSRNLMCLDNDELGVLDFQDAVMGPITYDLVSLLKDCYVAWPEEKIKEWLLYYKNLVEANKLCRPVSVELFLRWFDWMGIQRHLKCLGIFTRLYLRDGKEGYLKELGRVSSYISNAANHYDELKGLLPYLKDKE